MTKKVIDVSYHNGVIDWESVKAAGIDGAIIRCGFGDNITSQDDTQLKRNADECTRLGIPFGVYIYSYAKTIAQAESEAQHILRLISGYRLSYPVYLDLEQAGTESGATERANKFGDIIEAAGYWCGVYANKNWWDNHLVGLTRFTRWVARYNDTLGMDNVDMWQYTSDGSVPGISGRVDMNHCYRDFPKEITGSSGGSGGTGTPSGGASSGSAYTGNSIVDYLKSIGQDSSFANRKKLADQYGISNYSGTAAQNTQLLNLMRGGAGSGSSSGYTGSSIVDYLKSIGKDSSFAARKQYAAQYGIANYSGTAAQNTQLLNLMRGGSAPAASSYYPAFSSSSIVDGLKSIGVDSSFFHRSKIAAANGISGYSGTATQNNKLCRLAKQGKLKKA